MLLEAVLTLSSTTNGHMAVAKAWEALEKQTDLKLRDLAEREEECFLFEQITADQNSNYFSAFTVLKN